MSSSVFTELKRRKVFRVAGGYLLVAWLALQVAGSLESALELPRWFDGFVVAALAVMFPVALVLAWAFDLTADGVKRTGDEGVAAERIPRWAGALLLVVAMLGGGGIAAFWFFTSGEPETPVPVEADPGPADAVPERGAPLKEVDSIAVLPLAALNADEAVLERLGLGISDELRNVLARVQGVRVASRPSSLAFVGAARTSGPEMAESLGVRYILGGSLQQAGSQLRVTVQLIEGPTDTQVMSKSFDLPFSVDNIFVIQDEVAEEVVTALGRSLGSSARDALRFVAASGTDDLQAYSAYIDARLRFNRRNRLSDPEAFESIQRGFEDATRFDPDFGHAWAGLAMQYYTLIAWGGDPDALRMQARDAAQRALALDDNLALAHAVLGVTALLPDGRIDRVAAIDGLTRAIDLDPFEPALWSWRGQHWIELGFFDRGIDDLERTIELSQTDGVANFWIISTRLFQGDIEAATQRTNPNLWASPRFKVMLAMAMKPDFTDVEVRAALLGDSRVADDGSEGASRDGAEPPVPDGVEDHVRRTRQLLTEAAGALTDAGYDFDAGYERSVRIAADDDVLADRVAHPHWLYLFRQFDRLPEEPPLSGRLTWWFQAHADFQRSPIRYRYFHGLGLIDYWRARGFPPRCSPDGSPQGYSCE